MKILRIDSNFLSEKEFIIRQICDFFEIKRFEIIVRDDFYHSYS